MARSISAQWQGGHGDADGSEIASGGIRGERGKKVDAPEQALSDDDVRDHLEALLVGIRTGCARGLHRYLERVPAEVVKAVLATTGPETPEEETIAAFRRAGEAATLLALIHEYRRRLEMLRARGGDVFIEAAQLELLLIDHPAREQEQRAPRRGVPCV